MAQAQKAMAQVQKAMQQRAVGGAAGAPAFAPPTPYPSFDDVDAAIKPLSAGVSLWVGDYPDTAEGNEALDGVLKQPAHAEKLARFAAMECDDADTFPRRVVMRAKSIVAELTGLARRARAPAAPPACRTRP